MNRWTPPEWRVTQARYSRDQFVALLGRPRESPPTVQNQRWEPVHIVARLVWDYCREAARFFCVPVAYTHDGGLATFAVLPLLGSLRGDVAWHSKQAQLRDLVVVNHRGNALEVWRWAYPAPYYIKGIVGGEEILLADRRNMPHRATCCTNGMWFVCLNSTFSQPDSQDYLSSVLVADLCLRLKGNEALKDRNLACKEVGVPREVHGQLEHAEFFFNRAVPDQGFVCSIQSAYTFIELTVVSLAQMWATRKFTALSETTFCSDIFQIKDALLLCNKGGYRSFIISASTMPQGTLSVYQVNEGKSRSLRTVPSGITKIARVSQLSECLFCISSEPRYAPPFGVELEIWDVDNTSSAAQRQVIRCHDNCYEVIGEGGMVLSLIREGNQCHLQHWELRLLSFITEPHPTEFVIEGGRMSRHAKNNTASAVFTHYEKSRLQYGTRKAVLARESIKGWDQCTLCLSDAVHPMCCPEGHLFCQECILEYLLKQKKDLAKASKIWEEQQRQKAEEEERKKEEAHRKTVEEFDKREAGLLVTPSASSTTSTSTSTSTSSSTTTTSASPDTPKPNPVAPNDRLTCFWVPQAAPTAGPAQAAKPPAAPDCPAAKHPLRLKQLISIVFDEKEDTAAKSPTHTSKPEKRCPVCLKTLNNASQSAVLRSCGHAYCHSCLTKLVSTDEATSTSTSTTSSTTTPTSTTPTKTRSEKMIGSKGGRCFVCSAPFKDSHVIKLQTGGTGFSGHGDKLLAEKYTPAARV
ncbi:E3 ubiquitin-protein ligase CSU1 [Pelomyxa schiedti]|nr:E3 ubiquitin-protein ligase CSU1 [Pelomyxa schiedti]